MAHRDIVHYSGSVSTAWNFMKKIITSQCLSRKNFVIIKLSQCIGVYLTILSHKFIVAPGILEDSWNYFSCCIAGKIVILLNIVKMYSHQQRHAFKIYINRKVGVYRNSSNHLHTRASIISRDRFSCPIYRKDRSFHFPSIVYICIPPRGVSSKMRRWNVGYCDDVTDSFENKIFTSSI